MLEVKRVNTIDDFKKIPAIQKSAWGFTDLDTEPHHLMTRVQKYGGLVHGLYEEGVLIGFTYAVVGRWRGEHFIYSHMAAVQKEHQSKGYGFALKRAQREEVLKMGYDLMRWNFDPLESMNGYFNFHRLGVVSKEYERNIYGEGESGLHKGLATDRLIATWNLTSDRVAERMKGKVPSIVEEVPPARLNRFTEEVAYIEIPRDIRSMKETDMALAIEWRKKTRGFFESAFQKGYVTEDVVFSGDRQRIFYKLFNRQVSA